MVDEGRAFQQQIAGGRHAVVSLESRLGLRKSADRGKSISTFQTTMAAFKASVLADRAVLRLSGKDRTSFLQGLVTADVAGLAAGAARWAALLTPQGKILFDFLVLEQGDPYLVDCARQQLEELKQRLVFYKLRAALAIEPVSGVTVSALPPGGSLAMPSAVVFRDPSVRAMGNRAISADDYAPALREAAARSARSCPRPIGAASRSSGSIGWRKRSRRAIRSGRAQPRSKWKSRAGRSSLCPALLLPDRREESPWRAVQSAVKPSRSCAAAGSAAIRSISPITTRNGACRSATPGRCSRSCCSTASRPDCRGSPSCASGMPSAPPSMGLIRRGWHATGRRTAR